MYRHMPNVKNQIITQIYIHTKITVQHTQILIVSRLLVVVDYFFLNSPKFFCPDGFVDGNTIVHVDVGRKLIELHLEIKHLTQKVYNLSIQLQTGIADKEVAEADWSGYNNHQMFLILACQSARTNICVHSMQSRHPIPTSPSN